MVFGGEKEDAVFSLPVICRGNIFVEVVNGEERLLPFYGTTHFLLRAKLVFIATLQLSGT